MMLRMIPRRQPPDDNSICYLPSSFFCCFTSPVYLYIFAYNETRFDIWHPFINRAAHCHCHCQLLIVGIHQTFVFTSHSLEPELNYNCRCFAIMLCMKGKRASASNHRDRSRAESYSAVRWTLTVPTPQADDARAGGEARSASTERCSDWKTYLQERKLNSRALSLCITHSLTFPTGEIFCIKGIVKLR